MLLKVLPKKKKNTNLRWDHSMWGDFRLGKKKGHLMLQIEAKALRRKITIGLFCGILECVS